MLRPDFLVINIFLVLELMDPSKWAVTLEFLHETGPAESGASGGVGAEHQ